MFIIFFAIWVIFNGQLTLEIAVFGAVISALLYAFICKFMGYQPKTDRLLIKKVFLFLQYAVVLVVEILKANVGVVRLILTSRYELEPAIVHFKVDLKSTPARILLANSITLTPGTITVLLVDNEYTVHCLDKELATGIDQSVFVKLLQNMERVE